MPDDPRFEVIRHTELQARDAGAVEFARQRQLEKIARLKESHAEAVRSAEIERVSGMPTEYAVSGIRVVFLNWRLNRAKERLGQPE